MSKTSQLATLDNTQLASVFNNRNRLINGDFRVANRSVGSPSASTLTYILDRWAGYVSQASKLSFGQSNTAVGSMGFYCMTAQVAASYTPASTDLFCMLQLVEGYNWADMKWGSTSASLAKPAILSFWAACNNTGTYAGSINIASGYSFVFTYTITAANVWQYFSIPITPFTLGAVSITNTSALSVRFCLGAGSTYQTNTPNTWLSGNYHNTTTAQNLVSQANTSTLFITNIQLEEGTVSTPFELPDIAKSIASCERYYEIGSGVTTCYQSTGNGITYASQYKVTKRAIPTVVFSNITYSNCSGLTVGASTNDSVSMQAVTTATGAAYFTCNWTADSELYA